MALKNIRRALAAVDAIAGGTAVISGVVREQTTPVANRTVYLLRQDDLRVRRRTVSAADGTFSFTGLASDTEWMLLTVDPVGAYNAVVADRVMT